MARLEPLRSVLRPRTGGKCLVLPLHYLFGAIPVGRNG
jgi:hypothetical protein